MLQIISNLNEFIDYCNILIHEDQDEDTTEWFLHLIAQGATRDEIISDMNINLGIYYKWLGIAQKREEYLKCGTIWNALEIENQHYYNLGKHLLNKSIKKEIDEINETLKRKHLNVL